MLPCTADRPPELHDVGAPQTVDQRAPVRRGGAVVRRSRACPTRLRGLVALARRPGRCRGDHGSTGPGPGAPQPAVPRAARRHGAGGARLGRAEAGAVGAPALAGAGGDDLDALARLVEPTRGVIVAGRGHRRPAVGARTGRGARLAGAGRPAVGLPADCRWRVGTSTASLRVAPFADAHRPDVVLRLGEPPASKVLASGSRARGAVQVQVDGPTRVVRPGPRPSRSHCSTPIARCCRAPSCSARASGTRRAWLDGWSAAEQVAPSAASSRAAEAEPAERAGRSPGARVGGARLPAATTSSCRRRCRCATSSGTRRRAAASRVLANRGANGIDGVVSTAVGVAARARGAPTAVLIGDVAFLHDSNALLALAGRAASTSRSWSSTTTAAASSRSCRQGDALDADRFEQLFGTPHGIDLAALAAAHGARRMHRRRRPAGAATVARPRRRTRVSALASDRRQRTSPRIRRPTPPSPPPHRLSGHRRRASATATPGQGRTMRGEHGLELGLGLGQLGVRARSRRRCRRRRPGGRRGGPSQLGAADADRPRAVAGGVDPARRRRRSDPRSKPSTSSIRASAVARGAPPTAGVGGSARTSSSTGRARLGQPALDRAWPGAARWPRRRSTARAPSRGSCSRAAGCRGPCRS